MNKQQPFIYIDSSEQEDDRDEIMVSNYKGHPVQTIGNRQIKRSRRNEVLKNKGILSSKKCVSLSYTNKKLRKKLSVDDEFEKEIQNIITEKIDKEMTNKILTQIQQTELENNIDKRNCHYKYLMQKIKIDQKYQKMQQEKSAKLKQQNLRKKAILQQKQSEKNIREQNLNSQKYVIDKQNKQDNIIKHLHKKSHQLKKQRQIITYKKVRSILRERRKQHSDQITSKNTKQNNEIAELREQLERIKQSKRVNKIEQRKVINQLKSQTLSQKDLLNQLLKKDQQFRV